MAKYQFKSSVFEFCHFSEYLQAYFLDRKKSNSYTIDKFSADTGLARANLWRIIEDKAPLNERAKSFAIAKAIGMTADERQYFEALIDFNQSESSHEALDRLDTLIELLPKKYMETFVARFGIFPHWLTQAIKEIVQMSSFDGSYLNLSRKFRFEVHSHEIKRALEVLLQNNIIKKVEKNTFESTNNFDSIRMNVGTNEFEKKFAKKAVYALQSKQLDLAYAASNHFDLEHCYMVNHTISLPSDKIGEFEKLILIFKSEIETLMKKYPSNQANQVIQINTSMLPLTDVLD